VLARLTTCHQLDAKTLTNLWPSNDRASRSADKVAPLFRAQVCTGQPTRMPAQVTSVAGSARSETEQAPATPVGRRRGAERHQALRQHPGQDLAYDTVEQLVP